MLGLPLKPISVPADRSFHRLSPEDVVRLTVTHVAKEFELDCAALLGGTRGSPHAAGARQVAMYVAHVLFALDFGAIGRAFGRDRTTVAHACRVVENRRDDFAFDLRIAALEALCSSALGGDAR